MGSNQHPLAIFNLWNNLFVPVGQRPGNGVLEALTGWKLIVCQVGITSVLAQMRKLLLLIVLQAQELTLMLSRCLCM